MQNACCAYLSSGEVLCFEEFFYLRFWGFVVLPLETRFHLSVFVREEIVWSVSRAV